MVSNVGVILTRMMDVQYCGGCSVVWRIILSRMGDVQYCGCYFDQDERGSVLWGVGSRVGNYRGEGGGCSVRWGVY